MTDLGVGIERENAPARDTGPTRGAGGVPIEPGLRSLPVNGERMTLPQAIEKAAELGVTGLAIAYGDKRSAQRVMAPEELKKLIEGVHAKAAPGAELPKAYGVVVSESGRVAIVNTGRKNAVEYVQVRQEPAGAPASDLHGVRPIRQRSDLEEHLRKHPGQLLAYNQQNRELVVRELNAISDKALEEMNETWADTYRHYKDHGLLWRLPADKDKFEHGLPGVFPKRYEENRHLYDAIQALIGDPKWLKDEVTSRSTAGQVLHPEDARKLAVESAGARAKWLELGWLVVGAAGALQARAAARGPEPVERAPESAGSPERAAAAREQLIVERRAANAELRASERFKADMEKVGVTEKQIKDMDAKRVPLGFGSEAEFKEFKAELDAALRKARLADAEAGLKGTSTTFYSENPGKPLGHHWDADPANPGDFDVNVHSPTLTAEMQARGIAPSPRYGIFTAKSIEQVYPELEALQLRWTERLGRDVNIVGNPEAPVRDATEYVLRSR